MTTPAQRAAENDNPAMSAAEQLDAEWRLSRDPKREIRIKEAAAVIEREYATELSDRGITAAASRAAKTIAMTFNSGANIDQYAAIIEEQFESLTTERRECVRVMKMAEAQLQLSDKRGVSIQSPLDILADRKRLLTQLRELIGKMRMANDDFVSDNYGHVPKYSGCCPVCLSMIDFDTKKEMDKEHRVWARRIKAIGKENKRRRKA